MTWSFQMVSSSRSRFSFVRTARSPAMRKAGSLPDRISADRLLMDSKFRGPFRAEIFRTAALRSRLTRYRRRWRPPVAPPIHAVRTAAMTPFGFDNGAAASKWVANRLHAIGAGNRRGPIEQDNGGFRKALYTSLDLALDPIDPQLARSSSTVPLARHRIGRLPRDIPAGRRRAQPHRLRAAWPT